MVAIILGLFFGSILAVFISLKSKDLELAKNKIIAQPKENLVSPNQSGEEIKLLELSSPSDNAIVSSNTVDLKGSAAKDALIVIQSPIKDLVFVNSTENFDQTFPLALGENSLKIVVYPKEKQFRPQEKFIKIYYIDSEL